MSVSIQVVIRKREVRNFHCGILAAALRNLYPESHLHTVTSMHVLPPASNPGLFESIKTFITQNLGKPLSIASLCRQFGIGRNALNHLFKSATGLTTHAYIISERMKAAEKMLQSGTKVVAVARAVGYRNTAAFIRAFKDYHQVTPGTQKGIS